MPQYVHGNMWDVYEEDNYFIITTNSYIKMNGELVMGRGIAAQMKQKFPSFPLTAGTIIHDQCGHLGTYGLIIGKKHGLFQVKHHFKDPANLKLIELATNQLSNHANQHPDATYVLNFPGIGNGRLSVDQVKPIIDTLPENVYVYRA